MDDEIDYSKFIKGMEQFREALLPTLTRMGEAMAKICEEMVPLIAAEGLGYLEMELKLQSEVGLRTDLLALLD